MLIYHFRPAEKIIKATSICRRLLTLAGGPPQTGKILAALTQALYVRFENFLVSVTSEEFGNLPLGILLPRLSLRLFNDFHPDDSAELSANKLCFPNCRFTIDFSSATSWSNQHPDRPGMADIRVFERNLNVLEKELVAAINFDEEFFRAAQLATSLTAKGVGCNLNPYSGKALFVLKNVVKLWRVGRTNQACHEAQQLLGLGPGLTPSGDDFLLGMLATFWLAVKMFPQRSEKFILFIKMVGNFEPEKTTVMGYAFLKEATKGALPEKLHDLTHSLLSAESGHVIRCSRKLVKLGATSGGDMAAGVLFGGYLVLGDCLRNPLL